MVINPPVEAVDEKEVYREVGEEEEEEEEEGEGEGGGGGGGG
jgi:hypothetical protein